jgi:hypothetical protein
MKELLILAAKAAGVELIKWYDSADAFMCKDHLETWWNPLIDDGDALRLAVKLGIDITTNLDSTQCLYGFDSCVELHKDDPYAATRIAIVKAAAEIGRTMP